MIKKVHITGVCSIAQYNSRRIYIYFHFIYIIFIRQWVLDHSDTVRYIIQERIERRDRQIVRLDTKKKRRNSTYTKLKKVLYTQYNISLIFIFIYLIKQIMASLLTDDNNTTTTTTLK